MRRWTDAGHRTAHRCRNPISRSTQDHRGGMNLVPPIRTLRVLPRAAHLLAWTSDGSFLPPLQPHSPPHFFSVILSHAHAVIGWAPRHSLGTPSHRSFPQLN